MDAILPSQLPPDVDRRQPLEIIWWTEFGVATAFMVLRFWARAIRRQFGWDDVFMTASYILYLVDAILITYVAENGGTRHMILLGSVEKVQWALKFYIIILDVGIFLTGFGKVAIGATILRIIGNTSRWKRWLVWGVVALNVATCIIDFCISTFRCGNPNRTWDVMAFPTMYCIVSPAAQKNVNAFANACQVLADFVFSILPMAIVWRLHMSQKRKLLLMTALSLTLVTGTAAIIKLVYAWLMEETDLSYTIFHSLVWFSTEAMLIIVCGSVPVMQPLYDRFFTSPKSFT